MFSRYLSAPASTCCGITVGTTMQQWKEDNTVQGYVYIANCPEKCVIRSWYKPVVKTVFFGGFGLSYKLPFDRMVVLSRSPEMVNKR
jgi:hypothetical protein